MANKNIKPCSTLLTIRGMQDAIAAEHLFILCQQTQKKQGGDAEYRRRHRAADTLGAVGVVHTDRSLWKTGGIY